jgi:hypothetical protein
MKTKLIIGSVLLLIAAPLLLFALEQSHDAHIMSVLRRKDSFIVSTTEGIYQASATWKIFHKMDMPPTMPPVGELVQGGPDSPLLAYYDRWWHPSMVDPKGPFDWGANFISKDAGKSWEKIAPGRHFIAFFFHPNGSLFAVEAVAALEAPPEGVSAWSSDAQGRKMYLFNRLVVSRDMGATWKEFSPHLPGYDDEYSLYQDPDHADQVCFTASSMTPDTKPGVSQADDATYQHWKWTETTWRDNGMWLGSHLLWNRSDTDFGPTLFTFFLQPHSK